MRQLLRANSAAIRRVVEGYHARNPRVFGSVAHGDDNTDSDIDILVEPTAETTLMDIGAIRLELRRLLGVPVDVLTLNALPESFRRSRSRGCLAALDFKKMSWPCLTWADCSCLYF